MNILKWILVLTWTSIGIYINIKCGFIIMSLYYIGSLCFALYKLFSEIDK